MTLSVGFAHGDGHVAINRWARSWIARFLVVFALLTCAGAVSAASYVDASLPDVKPEDRVVVAHPQPVQLLFQFETKGAPNGRATKLVTPKIVDAVKASGLFSDVSDAATPNGAILSVEINDVADAKDMQSAETQGFMTGFTLGLAGSTVRDNYICTVEYVGGPNAPKLTRTAHHAIIFQMGLIKDTPTNAVKAANLNDAVYTMIRQIVSNPLNDLARDPAFQMASGTTAAPAPTADNSQSPSAPPAPAATSASPPTTAIASPQPTAAPPASTAQADPSTLPAAAKP